MHRSNILYRNVWIFKRVSHFKRFSPQRKWPNDKNGESLIIKYQKLSFSKYIDRFMQESIKYNKDGICKFSRVKFIQSPFILQERFLKKVFCTIGGKTYPPKSKIINRIIKNICSENFSNITAGKVFFDIKRWYCRPITILLYSLSKIIII